MADTHPIHVLPALPYPLDALEPHYDKATLEVHHGKHHAAYVEKLNQAIAGLPGLRAKTVEELLADIHEVPLAIRRKVINNGGGHANHSLFWRILAPAGKGGGEPGGRLEQAIRAEFGSFETFRQKFTDAAMEHFGSGWTFLVQDMDGRLSLRNYPNQDSPISDRLKPLLLVDLWEHAYYLKWKNRKAEWIGTWWNMVDWSRVEANHAEEPAWLVTHAEEG